MASRTGVALLSVLILAVLATVVAESTAVGSQAAQKPVAGVAGTVSANAAIPSVWARGVQKRPITVIRGDSSAIIFTDERAIAYHLALTQAQIESFETALAKDLAHGDFRAPQTRRAVAARRSHAAAARSTAEKLSSARHELRRLKAALRTDIANGEFRAPHTRAEVSKADATPRGTGNDALASGEVALSDGIWSLKMAVERDLHAHRFRAVETHFDIDGRRWKVN